MGANCAAIASGTKSNEPLPGWEITEGCSCAMTMTSKCTKHFSTSLACSSRSDTYETASKGSNLSPSALVSASVARFNPVDPLHIFVWSAGGLNPVKEQAHHF